jgi:hypothetical protein
VSDWVQIASDPERFAAWGREQAIRRVELRQRLYKGMAWGVMVLLVLAVVGVGGVAVNAYQDREHERAVDRWEECQDAIYDDEGYNDAFGDYLRAGIEQHPLRRRAADRELDAIDAQVDRECGERR